MHLLSFRTFVKVHPETMSLSSLEHLKLKVTCSMKSFQTKTFMFPFLTMKI